MELRNAVDDVFARFTRARQISTGLTMKIYHRIRNVKNAERNGKKRKESTHAREERSERGGGRATAARRRRQQQQGGR